MTHIKLPVHFFEDDRLKAVRSQKDGGTVILLFTMLITVAVKSNAGGKLILCEGIPYDEKILSGILNLKESAVKEGLELLVKFGLLTVEDNVFSLVGYNEYADSKAVRERRQNADRQARFKAKQSNIPITITPPKPSKSAAAGNEA